MATDLRRRARRRRDRLALAAGWDRRLETYLAGADRPRLHVGCGGHILRGWLNVDRDPGPGAVYLDVTSSFPLPSASFECVFSEHLIEHIDWEQGLSMLEECHRVLRPGGRIRVGTPDLRRVFELFQTDQDERSRRYMEQYAEAFLPPGRRGPAFVANQAFRGWGHKFLHDEDSLETALRSAGFVDVRRLAWGETDDERFRGVEAAGDDFTRDCRSYETLCLEAGRRPLR